MLAEVLTEQTVDPGLEAADKNDVIERLLDLVCATGMVRDRETALRDILANERRSSTGMQHGIAIPHAKTAVVDRLVAAVAVTRQGIDFESLDGKPSRIFIMTLSPADESGPHIRFLAEIGRLLKHRGTRQSVLSARTRAELLAAMVAQTR